MLIAESLVATIPIWLVLVIAVIPAALLAVLILTTMLLWHCRANRALLHTERMRSIEAGRPLDMSDETKLAAKYMHNAFWISFWLGFGVPAVCFGSALAATRAIDRSLGLLLVIWICTALATIAGVVCAIVLMICARSRRVVDANPSKPEIAGPAT